MEDVRMLLKAIQKERLLMGAAFLFVYRYLSINFY